MRVIAGDIGGTKSLLALMEVDPDQSTYGILREHTFESKRFDSLTAVVKEFLQEAGSKVNRAGFGLACPVVDDECDTTNLPWHVQRSRLAEEMNISNTILINDFEAIGYGLDLLGPEDIASLQEGTPNPRGPIALLGAGTGLGEAFLIWEADRYRVYSSEGGHADFAPRNDIEMNLLKFLWQRERHVSYERRLSGAGLVGIYKCLVQTGIEPENLSIRAEMEREDAAAVISRHAVAGTDRACVRALDLFAAVYGAEAGNLALKVLARGGVYLAGGIAPKIIDKLRDGTFIEAFRDKGRLSSFVQDVPVRVITNPKVGLLGAALVAARS
jgi:glucokinase